MENAAIDRRGISFGCVSLNVPYRYISAEIICRSSDESAAPLFVLNGNA